MRWSIGLGRILGIRFRIHVTFLLLLLFIFLAAPSEKGPSAGLRGVLFMCAVFACVLIHELGHSLVARRFGKEVRSITLLPIGGVATMEEMPEKPGQEIAMAAIGPFINLAIAGVLYLIAGGGAGITAPEMYPGPAQELLGSLITVNIMLAVFNMVPAFPMDGGRVLRGLLALKLDFVRATSIAVTVGQGFAMLMIFLGILGNLWLAIIGFFLYLGAGGEHRAVMMRSVLRKVPAAEAMVTEFKHLRPDEPLSRALEYVHRGCQEDFPVIGERGLEGILTRSGMIAAIHEKGVDVAVSDVMNPNFIAVGAVTPLDEVFRQVFTGGKAAAAVVENGNLLGMLCPEGLSRFLAIRLALKGLGPG